MNFNNTLKSFLSHLKSKWFIYFTVIVAFIVVWFVLCYGQATKAPKNQVLYVWVTPNSDESSYSYYEEITNIIYGFYDTKENYGYKKLDKKVAYASKTNSDEMTTFTLYADRYVDLFFMPTDCFTNDVDVFNKELEKDLSEMTDLMIMKYSNTNYCNRFADLKDLFSADHKNYAEYQTLLEELQNKGILVTYKGISADKTELEPKVVGIQINKDYVLAISKYHTTQNETLYNLIYDLVKDLV